MQVQNAVGPEAMQTVRVDFRPPGSIHSAVTCSINPWHVVHSFELGGEKKTKGAALNFVRLPCIHRYPDNVLMSQIFSEGMAVISFT